MNALTSQLRKSRLMCSALFATATAASIAITEHSLSQDVLANTVENLPTQSHWPISPSVDQCLSWQVPLTNPRGSLISAQLSNVKMLSRKLRS